MAITRAQQFRQMLKNAGAVEQDGVMNYIKNSESVTVPKKFKARKNAPATKLAYITDAEAKMLKNKKPGTPHKGPKGIPSYDSFDAQGNYTSGEAMSAAERGDIRQAVNEGMSERDARDIRASAIRAGAGTGRDESPERKQQIVSQATDLFNLRNQQLGSAANKTAAQKKAFRDFYKGMGLGDEAILADLEGEDDDAKPAFDFASLSGDDPANILADDKRQELVERYINEPVEGTDLGILSIDTATGALADILGKNQAKLRQRTVDLSEKLSKERPINYPGFMTKDGKPMSFDANLRTKSNLLSNLLDTEKTKLGLKGDPETGRVDFYDLPTSSQKEIGKKLNDARMQGLTDASGNFKAGVRIEKIPFRKADGTIEMRDQIIDNRDDRGGGSDPVTITSNPELLKLQKQNKDLQNQLAQQDQNIFYRLAADGGMIEDAPVGGIMDLETGRQMYFLGKLVKKATRAVKKIVKSPLGKAALGFAAFKFGPGIGAFLKDKALDFGLYKAGEGLTGKGMFSLAAALTAAPLLFQKEEEEQTIDPALLGPRLDIPGILANPYQASLGAGFRRTAADGGRIGYSEGDLSRDKVYQKWAERYEKNPESPLVTMHENFEKYKTFYESSKNKKADGGRIGFQEGGGIEQRLEKLGGDVSSAEKMLQGINQRLQSAESSLGSGGGGLGSIAQPLGVFKDPVTGGGQPISTAHAIMDTSGLFNRPLPGSPGVPDLNAFFAGGGGPKIPDAVKKEDPYARTILAGLSQDGQRFDSAQSAFDALAEQTRKTRETHRGRDVIGSELFQGAEGFKRFTDLFNKINDPGFVAPSLQGLLSAQGSSGIPAIGLAEGGDVEPVAKKTMPLLDLKGQEMDLRDNGGFVPIGRMEKADDVPARLSKNEFVFTADAVRNAGDGDVDKGAEVMYNMMKNLERGGNVSEESQGLEGARKMFQTAQRLEEVL